MDNKAELLEVGRASFEALEHSRTVVKEGARLIDVAESVESFLTKKGFGFSFPVNISINEKAAHYTPPRDDSSTFKAGDLVKIDIGARKGDALGDCAITIDLSGNHAKFVEAAEQSLEAAVSMVRAGPIRNLGGHGIVEGELHADIFIPNFDNGDTEELQEGQVVSIEPFVTDGAGLVRDSDDVQIFQKTADVAPRSKEARQILDVIDSKYLTYPFAVRWLESELKELSGFGVRRGMQELISLGALEAFPVLVERDGGIVAQAEKELLVEKGGCTILTK